MSDLRTETAGVNSRAVSSPLCPLSSTLEQRFAIRSSSRSAGWLI